jgi:hypothetical protein
MEKICHIKNHWAKVDKSHLSSSNPQELGLWKFRKPWKLKQLYTHLFERIAPPQKKFPIWKTEAPCFQMCLEV